MRDINQDFAPDKYADLAAANFDAEKVASFTSKPFEVVRHHPSVSGTMYALCARWKANCNNPDLQSGRCERCWTRKSQCYCTKLAEQRKVYAPAAPEAPATNPLSIKGCEVIM